MRGKLWKHFDQAGLAEIVVHGFKGEPLSTTRRIRSEYKAEVNWTTDEVVNSGLLMDEVFTTNLVYNALGQVTKQSSPDSSVTTPTFLPTGKLKTVDVQLKGEDANTSFVNDIVYNPKGQREKITYGNSTETVYSYERETFRLTGIVTTRTSDSGELQNISYTYDPVGNITHIIDNSHDRVFNNNQQIDPEMKYVYDAQGNRVRKVSERVTNAANGAIEVEDKIYHRN